MNKVKEYWVAIALIAMIELVGSATELLSRQYCSHQAATTTLPRPRADITEHNGADDPVVTIQIPLSAAVEAGVTEVQLDPVAQQ